jgi:histidinol-phosphate aminotransferase
VTQAVGARGRVAPAHDGRRGARYGHDLEAMHDLVSKCTRVVFIANPNNPTGTWLGEAELRSFVRSLPRSVLVVIDEAYFEYVQEDSYPDTTAWVAEHPNLIVTRTFSKAHGLAGLRVGYAVSHPEVADLLNRVRQPFNVNAAAQEAARAALDDQAHIARSVRLNREGMELLCHALGELGLEYIPSVGNFVCIDTGRPGREVYDALLHKGVITRPVGNYGLPRHLRITVGLPEQNRRAMRALAEVLRG